MDIFSEILAGISQVHFLVSLRVSVFLDMGEIILTRFVLHECQHYVFVAWFRHDVIPSRMELLSIGLEASAHIPQQKKVLY